MAYVVTGGTGFIGRHLLRELDRREQPIHVLVRPRSIARLERLGLRNARPLLGDITRPGLGIDTAALDGLAGAEVFHLAAVYDLAADEEANRLANVEGTRHAIELANRIGASRLHHVSSIAVAGAHFRGPFTEDMLDEGQLLDQPYYQTKFAAERLVREEARVAFRAYPPGIVIGSPPAARGGHPAAPHQP